jgi:hypothetical protein
MQLAGQRGSLVGMVSTFPHHLCIISFLCNFTNLLVSMLLNETYHGSIFMKMVENEGPRQLYLGYAPAVIRSSFMSAFY